MYSEFEYNLAIKPSGYRRWLCCGQLALVLLLFAVHPVYGWWWLLLWPALFFSFYQLLQHWRQPVVADQCWLSAAGELRFADDVLPAGQILPSSLISQFGVLLRWQNQQQQTHLLWFYADNFSDADFRALCRVCQTVQWQQRGSEPRL
ncbi:MULTISPECIES: protein YgfX [Rheinheimera]|uniref:Protein YgfX n=1 Tax=Rheinheimera marina TaxID=1774958 RepID=A0ABV9JJC0_9GAMM